jgi:nifR3 family TIM-barrel protein
MHRKNQNIFLAPMEDVTDYPFRQVLLKIGRPKTFFTEFVNVDGLVSEGRKHVMHRLEKTEDESPIIVQLWGNKPENFVKATKFLGKFNFDGVNINLGCSVKKVLNAECGAALIGKKELVKDIVKGVQDATDCPVSVKTRLGFDGIDLEWLGFLLGLKLETLFVHLRTAKQLFSGNADWNVVSEIVDLKNEISPKTQIVGNGDICNMAQAQEYIEKYKIDGIMIGREVLKNPWVFANIEPDDKERVQTLMFHLEKMEEFVQKYPEKGWSSIKKFYHGYLREKEELVSLRKKLFELNNISETKDILSSILRT